LTAIDEADPCLRFQSGLTSVGTRAALSSAPIYVYAGSAISD
jgi:hypothetical protein